MQKVIIEDKFNLFSEYWSPKIVGELNGQHVKLAKLKGEFVWHKHDEEDEMFLVIDGVLKMELRDKTIVINKNEFLIVPKGTEHRPVADSEVLVMLFEPATTLNTGNTENEMTKHFLETIQQNQNSTIKFHFFEFKEIDAKENYSGVYIRTDNIEDLYKSFVADKINIHPNGALASKPWGQKEFALLDPDNNLLTFGQGI